MAQEVDEVLAAEWRGRLKRQSGSGLTIAAFCEKEGVSESTFYAWKRNLQDSVSAPMASEVVHAAQRPDKKRVKRLRRQRPKSAPANKPTTHPPEFLRLPVRGVRSMPWIELTLVDGTVVRIPQLRLAPLRIKCLPRTILRSPRSALDRQTLFVRFFRRCRIAPINSP